MSPVKVHNSPGKGRGLFVTRAVKAGELLLCEKAFAYAWPPEHRNTLLNLQTTQRQGPGQVELIRMIVQKIFRNGSLLERFSRLYHGTYQASEMPEVDGSQIVDT
jgi:hypothetical protein